MSKKERILNIIKDFREFKFCGPSDDPDAQTAVCVGYNYLLVQLKRTATPFIPESFGKSLNQIEVEMNNLFSVYEASAEIDALLPDIEQIIQGLDESVFDQDKVGWDRVKSVAEQQEQKAHTSEVTEQQLKDEQEHKPTLLLLSRRLQHLLRILRWFRHFKGPETNKAEDALRQITDFLDKVRLTEETATALSHSLVAETLVILIKWRHQALETKRAIEWDIKQEPPYDCNSIAVNRIRNVFSKLCCYMNTIEHYAAILEADDILHRSMPREQTTKPWDAKQQKFREEHNDFLRRIAMDVFGLVSTLDKRAYFHKQVEAFSHKVEEHQKELEKIKKDYEANSKLQEAAKKLDEQIKNAPVDEEFGCSDLEIDLNMTNGWGMLENFKDYRYYDGGFWGPSAQTIDLVTFLVIPPSSWMFDLPKMPNDAEKLICSYTLLSAIHDKYIKEKPIFFDGSDELYHTQNPQHWVVKIEQRCVCFNAISGGYFDSVKDTQAWLQRVLSDVKTDLAGIGQAETDENTYPASVRDLLADIPEKDLRLFLEIGVDIRKHFDKYRDAGKWLDDYYDEARYWERRHLKLKGLRRVEAEGKALTPGQERDKEGLEHLIKEKRPPMLGHRLQGAWWALYRGNRDLIGQEEAKAILLIAWLATDVDADKVDLNLTQFEKWPWKSFGGGIKDNDIKQSGRELLRELLWSGPDAYPREEYYEVECLQLVRAAWARREAEKHLTSKPAETGKKIQSDKKPKAEAWEQITIKVVDDDTIKYKVNDKNWKRANYTEFGFLDKRKNQPNILWPIFLGLASKNLPSNIKRPEMKSKDIDRIRKTLRKFFGINNLPIRYNRRAKEYRCNFTFNDPRDWTGAIQNENLAD